MTSLWYNLARKKKSKKNQTHFILYLFSKKVIPISLYIYTLTLQTCCLVYEIYSTTKMNSTAKRKNWIRNVPLDTNHTLAIYPLKSPTTSISLLFFWCIRTGDYFIKYKNQCEVISYSLFVAKNYVRLKLMVLIIMVKCHKVGIIIINHLRRNGWSINCEWMNNWKLC